MTARNREGDPPETDAIRAAGGTVREAIGRRIGDDAAQARGTADTTAAARSAPERS